MPSRHQWPFVTEINMAEYGLFFICSMNLNPPYLFLSWEDNDGIRDIGKHVFHLVLVQPVLSNANQSEQEYLA